MLRISVFFIISHQNGFVHIHKELNEKQARRGGLWEKREKKKKIWMRPPLNSLQLYTDKTFCLEHIDKLFLKVYILTF